MSAFPENALFFYRKALILVDSARLGVSLIAVLFKSNTIKKREAFMRNDYQVKKPLKKRKRYVSARFFWITSVLAGIVFLIAFARMPVFPFKWRLYMLCILGFLLVLTFLLSIKTKARNGFTRFVNVTLTVCLFAGSFILPYETEKVSAMFSGIDTQYVKINLYALNGSAYAADQLNTESDLKTLSDAVFITDGQSDKDNADYVLDQMKTECGSALEMNEAANVLSAVHSLYTGSGDILIMSPAFESMLADTEEYSDFAQKTKVIYSFYRPAAGSASNGSEELTNKPFTVFIGGNDDTGELTLDGRTDVNILATVNPETYQVVTIGLPRDSYIPNPALSNQYDKLTHLGLQGLSNTMEGLGNYLDVKVDDYVLVNFTTFTEIIDAIGGIDIDNPYAFEWDYDDHHVFAEGKLHLDGDLALKYVRERHNLPDGDFGRNMHQQIVMKAIIEKVTSTDGIVHFNDLLDSLSGKFLTNLSSASIFGLIQKQLNENIHWNTVSYHVEGDVDMAECASSPGEELSIVIPYENQVEYIRKVIDQVEAGETISGEDLPAGISEEQTAF